MLLMKHKMTSTECRKILACHYGKSWHNERITEELETKFESGASQNDVELFINYIEGAIHEICGGHRADIGPDAS